ncbi:DUF2855 family protein [Saccharopolyspora flava]|uniref:NADPH:quinone reductase n=1 Tax=Saccharopolyspora flava TaxID=95161 RepID=A0A1I6SPF9_9PSEU|nr:DUF2855 family protein [Saccharopolyspora flava]SFS78698.1 Protein of unknown function [Saccharopolyspora flava]
MTSSTSSRVLEFLRSDPLHTTRITTEPLPAPGPGQVLLRIERFTLTSNNVTYARNGDQLGYWAPFPSHEPGWGRVPAWGAARVIDGDPALAEPGAMLTGFLPMATHVLVEGEPLADGLRATAPERQVLPPLYRDMPRADESLGDVELSVLLGVVRTAAHLSDEILSAEPAQVVFSSATSRTALTTASVLHRAGARVVGLTSPERAEAAARAEVYDAVVPYDDLGNLDAVAGTTYVDIAGRPSITAGAHRLLGDALTRSIRVGGTHPAEEPGTGVLPGPVVERFNVGARRVEVAERIGDEGLAAFERSAVGPVTAWATAHLTAERFTGLDEAEKAWGRVQRGELDPLTTAVALPN